MQTPKAQSKSRGICVISQIHYPVAHQQEKLHMVESGVTDGNAYQQTNSVTLKLHC